MNNFKNKNLKSRFIFFIKNNLISYIAFTVIVSLFSLIYAFLIYNDKLSFESNTFNIVLLITGIICFLILGFISGLKSHKNGLMSGLLSALIIILISLLINIIIKNNFTIKNIIKIISYLTSASIGGIIGVNIRK